MRNFMQDHGERLITNGYNILPIIPNGKVPGHFSGGNWGPKSHWQQYCERQPTDAELAQWSSWPDCGIGLACGSVIGVDLDVMDAEVAIGLERLAREMLGDTPALRIGRAPKRALFYRADIPFRGRKMHPLEIYGIGSQMVIHGVHPDTSNPYDWPGEALTEIDISQLPEITETQAINWLREAFKRIPDNLKPKTLARMDGDLRCGQSDPRGTYEAVKSALEFIPNLDLDGSSWIRVCNAIKAALGPEGMDLWVAWSKSSSKSGQSGKSNTAERRYKTARPTSIGAGSIYYMAQQRGWVPPSDVILNGARAEAEPIAMDGLVEKLSPPRSARPATREDIAAALPFDPMAAGGIIGKLVRLSVDTAISPQPFLALAAAIVAVGVLAGQKYKTWTNLRTNLYAVGVADSGGGKDNARQVIKDVFTAAGLANFLGGEEIASGPAISTMMYKHPCRICLLDEVGASIKNWTADRAPAHKAEIWTVLMKLYTSAASVALGTEYANQEERPRKDITQPCLGVYGTTTGDELWGNLHSGAMKSGALARFLVFKTPKNYPVRNKRPAEVIVDDALIADLHSIVAGVQSGEPTGNLACIAPPTPYKVMPDDDAQSLLDAVSDNESEMLEAAEPGTGERTILARRFEKIAKVSLILAISDCPPRPVITRANVELAIAIVDHCLRTLLDEAGHNIADNQTSKNHKLIENIIRKAGTSGITQSEITNKTDTMYKRERLDILDALMEGGKIFRREAKTSGRPSNKYFIFS